LLLGSILVILAEIHSIIIKHPVYNGHC
jgi:hypothetical protein